LFKILKLQNLPVKYMDKIQDGVAQTFIKFKCQLRLNLPLKLLEMYMKLIYM